MSDLFGTQILGFHMHRLKYNSYLYVVQLFISQTGKSVVGYNLSLTNDEHHYSNEIQAIIIDTSCMQCSDEGGVCSIKVKITY